MVFPERRPFATKWQGARLAAIYGVPGHFCFWCIIAGAAPAIEMGHRRHAGRHPALRCFLYIVPYFLGTIPQPWMKLSVFRWC
jgi:hypothetical protein